MLMVFFLSSFWVVGGGEMRVSPRLAWRWVAVFIIGFIFVGGWATWCGGHGVSLDICAHCAPRKSAVGCREQCVCGWMCGASGFWPVWEWVGF